MAQGYDDATIKKEISEYIAILKSSGLKIWRMYLYGSYAKGTFSENSDIDLAVFFDSDEIDGFEEDALLMKLRRKVDLKIEPHAFARSDFDQADPFVNRIIRDGKRLL